MIFFIPFFFFLFGLVIGSFLNVVILRGAAGEGLGGRSRCPHCRNTLGFSELIPLASFILQKGRCRGCNAGISAQYPIVELGTALAFAAAAWYFLPLLYGENGAMSVQALRGLGLVCAGIGAGLAILVSDIRFQIIPDGAVLVLGIVGFAASFTRGSLAADTFGAVGCALFFFLLWAVSGGRWMGFGDVKLVAATSLLVGFPASIAAVLFAFWMGGAAGGALLAAGRKAWGSRIPFGPFILAGAGTAWLWADAFLAFTGLGILL